MSENIGFSIRQKTDQKSSIRHLALDDWRVKVNRRIKFVLSLRSNSSEEFPSPTLRDRNPDNNVNISNNGSDIFGYFAFVQ